MDPKPYIVQPGDRQAALNVLGLNIIVLASRDNSRDQRIGLRM